MIGETVGSYKITGELGEGGIGVVYLAEHTLMGKQAAVKVLLPQYCAVTEVVERFFNEAKSASMIKHPGIVDIYDFGKRDDGSAFIIMELLEGEELSNLLSREPRLDGQRVALLGQQIARALEAAHDLDIIHRDLKPDNIFLEPDSSATGGVRPKILDFGIAKLGGDLSGSSVKTRTGAVMGTPIFMSPEQCTGAGEVDHRADIYSLGCILYLMVCGRLPFEKAGVGAIIAAQITETPKPPSFYESSVDSTLEAIIMSTLAKSPDERPQSMGALAVSLSALSGHNAEAIAVLTPSPRPPTAKEKPNQVGSAPKAELKSEKTKIASQGSGSNTTLGASTSSLAVPAVGDFPEVGRSNKRIFMAGGGIAVAAIAFWALRSGDTQQSTNSAAPQAATAPTQTESESSKPTTASVPTTPTAPIEVEATIVVAIESEPGGAAVYNAQTGIQLGTTPFSDTLTKGQGALEVLVKFADHETKMVSIPLQQNYSETITLVATSSDTTRRSGGG